MRLPVLTQAIFYIVAICNSFLLGCNLSDNSQALPGGHTYVDEGRCYKFILVNIKGESNIESCVSAYKYDDSYITVAQIDELKCKGSLPLKNEDKKFFIIDNKNERLLGPFSYLAFKIQFEKLHLNENLFLE